MSGLCRPDGIEDRHEYCRGHTHKGDAQSAYCTFEGPNFKCTGSSNAVAGTTHGGAKGDGVLYMEQFEDQRSEYAAE